MKNKRIYGLTLAVMLSAVSVINATSVFATSTTITNQGQPQKPENEVIGKITAINQSTVTIAVATRKEMEKPADGQQVGGTPPEKPANDGTAKEKLNMDNMFTLTGETKTINIASATFAGGPMGKPNENQTGAQTVTTETQKTKTYADYAVGDYITIECTDSTYGTAKTVCDAGMGGGPKDGNGQQQPQQ